MLCSVKKLQLVTERRLNELFGEKLEFNAHELMASRNRTHF